MMDETMLDETKLCTYLNTILFTIQHATEHQNDILDLFCCT